MEIIFQPIKKLIDTLEKRKISPVEVTEIFLNRLERFGTRYNSVVTVTSERAINEAKKAEKAINAGCITGTLHGIPFGVKDLLAAEGYPTSWGAAPFKNQVFNYDATVVKKLCQAGGILCAKLAMIELAGGMGYRQPNASFTGPPKNPWNPDFWTGGSSSGSGATVAAGMVPFAIGSETWGSILSPANNCGVSGLRPTYGRVSRYGAMALSWTLDKLGPLCLTAEDCGVVLEAIAGPDPKDQTTIDSSYKFKFDKMGDFKLAMLKDATNGIDTEVAENFEKSLTILERFASIEEIKFPDLPYEAITRIILNAEAASAFDEFTESGRARMLTAPEDQYGPYARTVVFARDYLKALRLRGIIAKKADIVMTPYDAVIAPARRSPASPVEEVFRKRAPGSSKDIMGALGNAAGLPSIAVPNGFTNNGLPTGIQFMGRAYEENTILSIAKAFQEQTDWHEKHPEL